jgi:hypothetical protein
MNDVHQWEEGVMGEVEKTDGSKLHYLRRRNGRGSTRSAARLAGSSAGRGAEAAPGASGFWARSRSTPGREARCSARSGGARRPGRAWREMVGQLGSVLQGREDREAGQGAAGAWRLSVPGGARCREKRGKESRRRPAGSGWERRRLSKGAGAPARVRDSGGCWA